MTLAYNLSQLANFVNSSGQLDAATGLTNTSSLGFPTGTLMLFQQTAAPTGWTKQTTHNNKALRVVSGTASSGGTSPFTTVFTDQTPTLSDGSIGATTLTTAQLASHNHQQGAHFYGSAGQYGFGGNIDRGAYSDGYGPCITVSNTNPSLLTSSSGSGNSHTHTYTPPTASTITLAVQYVDLIIASKN